MTVEGCSGLCDRTLLDNVFGWNLLGSGEVGGDKRQSEEAHELLAFVVRRVITWRHFGRMKGRLLFSIRPGAASLLSHSVKFKGVNLKSHSSLIFFQSIPSVFI